ncbi:soluble liver antigen/liver pancreas antigen [Paraphysoderma sedebokerense]|nr:soluble liver antigen/liver pancreas antigen [Paraphysoderma sedebokerense]KAI9138612.1 soluble liver antigen/liver pancreas antigen [Paraphysoderma sedebokerense]
MSNPSLQSNSITALLEPFLPPTYLALSQQSLSQRESLFSWILQHKKLPEHGWTESDVEWLLQMLSKMDSNNFDENAGLGEREARIAVPMVARRHYNFGHGIGRSGDITEIQPKAAGSSIIQQLTNHLVLDAIRLAGLSKRSDTKALVLPLATGLAISLCLRSVSRARPNAKYVVWTRIDQKSCFKSIITAGFIPIIVPPIHHSTTDELRTNVTGIEEAIERVGPENVVAVLSTSSCFAPRVPDDLPSISRLCRTLSIPHVVNNAYGIQSSKSIHLINESIRIGGRIDLIVQSTDKNFMVPVGGTVVVGEPKVVEKVATGYPGRASMAPILDLFITLLSLGKEGFKKYLDDRKANFKYLHEKLSDLAAMCGTKVLRTPKNDISIALSLHHLLSSQPDPETKVDARKLTFLGSMLFTRSVSGTRVVAPGERKVIEGYEFKGWGGHVDVYEPLNQSNSDESEIVNQMVVTTINDDKTQSERKNQKTEFDGHVKADGNENDETRRGIPYLTAAAAMGVQKSEIDTFIKRLDKCLKDFEKH